ncbi:MAG: regulatory protein TetR [Amnibacterium sp.]|nr:regulatory protein TetR [Amnibacterium sp.]
MRERLTAAARAQLREGGPMTVDAVAARAQVSRATAYRHFLNNDAVLLWATRPVQDAIVPAVVGSGGDHLAGLADRAEALVRATAQWAFDHERELRAVLAVSLGENSAQHGLSRRGRMQRDRWIDELLSGLPVDVPGAARWRLRAALMPLFGADAVVWTRDVADLSVTEAVEVLVWMARTLVTAVLTESGSGADSATAP